MMSNASTATCLQLGEERFDVSLDVPRQDLAEGEVVADKVHVCLGACDKGLETFLGDGAQERWLRCEDGCGKRWELLLDNCGMGG